MKSRRMPGAVFLPPEALTGSRSTSPSRFPLQHPWHKRGSAGNTPSHWEQARAGRGGEQVDDALEVSKGSEVKHKEQLSTAAPEPVTELRHRRLAEMRPGTKRVKPIDKDKVSPFDFFDDSDDEDGTTSGT